MRWAGSLTDEERRFLQAWARRAEQNGAIGDAYAAVWGRSMVHSHPSRTLGRLRESFDSWVGQGQDKPLPDITSGLLLGVLDEIRAEPKTTDRDKTTAAILRQRLAPADIRTYPPFTVDFLTAPQWKVFSDDTRFRVLVAGRQSGKTYLAITELIAAASSVPGSTCYFVGQTRKVVRRRPWKTLRDVLPSEYVQRISEPELHVYLRNGSQLIFEGAEAVEGLRGEGLDFLVLDEFAAWANPQSAWEGVLRPMLATTEGRALFVSTPKGFKSFLRRLYMKGGNALENEWASHHFTTKEGGLVSAEELRRARGDTDPRRWREEYEASFEKVTGQVFDYFDRNKHIPDVDKIAEAGSVLLCGIDFNLSPMSCVIAQRGEKEDDCEVLEALELPYSNTDELLDTVEEKYPDRTFIAYPDPSGRSRHTSAGGMTDFSIIDSRARWTVDKSMYRKSIPLADKINNCQSCLQSADGASHVTIHPVNGLPLIEALESLTYIEGTSQPDKSMGADHITDAFGYLLYGAFNRFRHKVTIGTFSL